VVATATRKGEHATSGGVSGGTGDRVIELDGGRAGPVDWGACKDLLEVRAVLPFFVWNNQSDSIQDVARIVKEDFVKRSNSVRFNIMYLGQPPKDSDE
jgi:ubiquitin carboxyl-terminal hydrolase L3